MAEPQVALDDVRTDGQMAELLELQAVGPSNNIQTPLARLRVAGLPGIANELDDELVVIDLFVALARSEGIPARDVYGIRVAGSQLGYKSLGKAGDITKAQHCRAEFYLPTHGWVPVDPAGGVPWVMGGNDHAVTGLTPIGNVVVARTRRAASASRRLPMVNAGILSFRPGRRCSLRCEWSG
mgnify:CR=1 FL=1